VLKDLVWADEAGCKLSLLVEMLHALEWGHSEIDKISNLDGKGSPSRISIALLSRLGGLQTVSDQLHLLFSFFDDVRTELQYLEFYAA
jgi:hypothetical protein